MTDNCKNITFARFATRAVIMTPQLAAIITTNETKYRVPSNEHSDEARHNGKSKADVICNREDKFSFSLE